MKNNKAFTIVELLAVMVMLSIILIIAYPNFSKMTESAKSKYDNSIKVLAKSAAKMYVNNNKEEIDNYFTNNPSGTYCLPLAKLAAYDYIDSYLRDSSGTDVDMKSCVNVTKSETSEGKIKYNYDLNGDIVEDGIDYLPPILTVNNKDAGTLDCTIVMRTSKDVFNSNCEVVAKDDNDTSLSINIEEKTIGNDIVITYTASDSSGNKSKPLKIKLINE